MLEKNEFAGDVLFVNTDDGGDIVIENGLVRDCRNFDTAVYLSLFGGKNGDTAGRPKETWWGNIIPGTKKSEQIRSEFSSIVAGLPMTSGNLQKAGDAAKRDLEWIKSDAGADSISVSLNAVNAVRVKLSAHIMADGHEVGGGLYEAQWQEGVRHGV